MITDQGAMTVTFHQDVLAGASQQHRAGLGILALRDKREVTA